VLVAWCGSGALANAENLVDMGADKVAFQLDALIEKSPALGQPIDSDRDSMKDAATPPRAEAESA
jgi:hypothetical protein